MVKRPRRRRGTVAARLMLSFVIIMVAFAVTVGYGVMTQRRAAQGSELLRSGYVPLLLSLGAALENQNLVSAQLNHITEAKNPADARRWIETARRLRPKLFADIRDAINAGVTSSADAEARELSKQIQQDAADIERFLAEDSASFALLFESLSVGDIEGAEPRRDELVAHEIEGARRLRDLKARVDAEIDRLITEARHRERRALESLVVLASLTLAVGIGMTLYARRVLRPLAVVTERAHAVAAGDLTPRPVLEARDEIGELATTFESMVEAIAKANEARLQSERLAVVGRMAAHVTHEIRNPLSSIGLNLELLEEELVMADASAEMRQLLQAIRREVDHLSGLSQEYLQLARPQQPRVEPESLNDLVTDVLGFVRPELQRAGIRLVMQLDEATPEVLIDETSLRQALKNLVRNAREAMARGGELTVQVGPAPDGDVELVIADDGPGIPQDIRHNIFDPFFTTKNRGTGLGLAITKQIVDSFGGTIACEAVQPHGTRFRIRLRSAANRVKQADDAQPMRQASGTRPANDPCG